MKASLPCLLVAFLLSSLLLASASGSELQAKGKLSATPAMELNIHPPEQETQDVLDDLTTLEHLEEDERRAENQDMQLEKKKLVQVQKLRVRNIVHASFDALAGIIPNPIKTKVRQTMSPYTFPFRKSANARFAMEPKFSQTHESVPPYRFASASAQQPDSMQQDTAPISPPGVSFPPLAPPQQFSNPPGMNNMAFENSQFGMPPMPPMSPFSMPPQEMGQQPQYPFLGSFPPPSPYFPPQSYPPNMPSSEGFLPPYPSGSMPMPYDMAGQGGMPPQMY
eukprot:GILI01013656.1.p1 GENE.GILI01013656.1~~GILI01013656.1.p1  ORF type:complete len:306 (+),score=55.06 GILI01013656.1:83-919(+)